MSTKHESKRFGKAIELIDAANSKDPNIEIDNGKKWPKELLYSLRMSDMIERYRPNADDAMKLAVRAQHIERWKFLRNDYPIGRTGYLKWRIALYAYHANTASGLLIEAGYDSEFIKRVKLAIEKKSLKHNQDTQLVEDVAVMVFIEHTMQAFVDKHPEYSNEKWMKIISKTWKKMTNNGQQFVDDGNIALPKLLMPMFKKALI